MEELSVLIDGHDDWLPAIRERYGIPEQATWFKVCWTAGDIVRVECEYLVKPPDEQTYELVLTNEAAQDT